MGSAIVSNLGRRGQRLNAGLQPVAVKRPPTKDVLIATGERLFGQFGIDGVSLREIGAAAGQTNRSAVQYHFKDKSGLISAILYDRVSKLEILRRELFRALGSRELKDPRALLRLQWVPTMSIRGSDGQHTFCRFLLQYMLRPQLVEHPGTLRDIQLTTARPDLVCLARAQRLLRALYPKLSPATYRGRQSILARIFLSAVVEHDNAYLLRSGTKNTEFDIEPILDVSIAALGAPEFRKANGSAGSHPRTGGE